MSPTSWRWLFRLMSSYRGESSVRIHSFEIPEHRVVSSASLRTSSQLFFSFLSVSRPDKVFFPPVNWKATNSYGVEQDVGPEVKHIYEVISHTLTDAVQTH